VALVCNPTFVRLRGQEDWGSRSAGVNSSWGPPPCLHSNQSKACACVCARVKLQCPEKKLLSYSCELKT
jgi:hypothetical protein